MSATNYDLFKKVQIYDSFMFQIIIKNKLFLKLSNTHIGKKSAANSAMLDLSRLFNVNLAQLFDQYSKKATP